MDSFFDADILDISKTFSGSSKTPDGQCDDLNYYSFKTVATGIKIHDLWDYIHEKCQSGSTFFEEEFKVRNSPNIKF